MSLVYKRLGSQGEIHIADGEYTLCGIRATHPNWVDKEELSDKDPLLCVDCHAVKSRDESNEEKKSE